MQPQPCALKLPPVFGGHSPKLSCWPHPGNTKWCFILPFKTPAGLMPSRQGWIWPLYSTTYESLPAQHIMFGGKSSCGSVTKINSQVSKDAMAMFPPTLVIQQDPDPNAWFCYRQLNKGGFAGFFCGLFFFRNKSWISMVFFKQTFVVSKTV